MKCGNQQPICGDQFQGGTEGLAPDRGLQFARCELCSAALRTRAAIDTQVLVSAPRTGRFFDQAGTIMGTGENRGHRDIAMSLARLFALSHYVWVQARVSGSVLFVISWSTASLRLSHYRRKVPF